MPRLTAKDFPQELLDYYDYYAHGKISKREFLSWCFFKQSISTCFCPVFRHSVSQTTGYALANR